MNRCRRWTATCARDTREELVRLQRELGIAFILVTHDQEEALTMADRIGVMHDGRLAQVGTPAEVYERPNSRFVAEFLGAANVLPIVARQRQDRTARTGMPVEHCDSVAGPNAAWLAIRPERMTLGASACCQPRGRRRRASAPTPARR